MCWPKCSQRNCRMKKTKGTFKCSSDLQHCNTCLPSVSLSQDVRALEKQRWEHPILHYSGRMVFTYWPWQSSCQNTSLAALRPILPHWVHPSGEDSHSLQLYQPSVRLWCPIPLCPHLLPYTRSSSPVQNSGPSPTLTAPCLCTFLAWVHLWNLSLTAPVSPQGHSNHPSVAEKLHTPCSQWLAACPWFPLSSPSTGWSAPLPLSRDSHTSEAAVQLFIDGT